MERSTVGALLRSTQAYCSQLCDKQTLGNGIAYYSQRFAKLPQANQYREVVMEDPSRFIAAFDEVEEWFRQHHLRCYRWAPAGGQPGEELSDFLIERGFDRRVYRAMLLTKWVDLEPAPHVRVLPARAMRAALRETFRGCDPQRAAPLHELGAEACAQRLDDPQFDLFVALVDGCPAGRCALYQVGDIARVIDLHVLSSFADRGVLRALTGQVLGLAKRLTMQRICMQINDNDAALLAWLERSGFVVDGTIVEFERCNV